MIRTKSSPKITETEEHLEIAKYFRATGLGGCATVFHIKNDQSTAWQRIRAKELGVMPGMPDWCIIDGGRAGFIELKTRGWRAKRERRGAYTLHELRQIETHNRLKRAGAWVAVCETLDEVKEALREHGVPLRQKSVIEEAMRAGFMRGMAEAAAEDDE